MNLRRESVSEVLRILESGDFDNILGVREGLQIEFKERLDLKNDKQKLAKTAASLANTDGGLIVVGVGSERDPATRTDYASKLIFSNSPDVGAYYRALSGLLYPPARITIDVFGNAPNQLVAIRVGRIEADYYPVLVTNTVSENLSGGSIFGYYKRTEEESIPVTHAQIHSLLRAGEKFQDLSDLRDAMVKIAENTTAIGEQLKVLINEKRL